MHELISIFNRLYSWANGGTKGMMDKTARGLAAKYRQDIFQGKNADGSSMPPLLTSTLEGPVRRESDSRIRKSMGNSPLDATGQTIASIQSSRTGDDEWTIAPQTERGRKVLESNAKTVHHGIPFYGDTRKAVRDPLSVEEAQLDFIENEIAKDIDRVLNNL